MQERITHVAAIMERAIDDGLPPYTEYHYDPGAQEMVFLWEEEKLAVVIEMTDDLTPEQQVFAAIGMPVMN